MKKRLANALAAAILCLPLIFPEGSAFSADAAVSAETLFRRARENLQAWDTEGARRDFDAFKAASGGSAPESNSTGSETKRRRGEILLEANILFEESRLDEAAALLKDFNSSFPDENAAAKVILDTARLTDGYLTAESSHFRMRYPPGKDALLVPYALETLEKARTAMQEAFGHAPRGKVTVEIYPNAESLSAATTLPLSAIKTTGTVAICKFSKIMAASPKSLIQGYAWLDTLAHEYVHLVVSQASGNNVPLWVHEGLAKFYESAWRSRPGDGGISPASAAFLVQEAKKNALIPFEKMQPSLALLPTQEDAALAYAEAFAAIEYLTSAYGSGAVSKLVAAYSKGLNDTRAFREATGKPFASFVAGWKDYVKKRPAPSEVIVMDAEKRRFGMEDSGNYPSDDAAVPPDGGKNEKFIISDFPDLKNPEAKRRAHLGELLRIRGRNRAAADEFRQAYAIARASSPMLSNRYAQALMAIPAADPDAANYRAKAAEVLSESRRLFPSWPRTLKHLAELFRASGRDADAARFYREAIAIDPFDPDLHSSLAALCAEKLRDRECASREETALKILSGHLRAWPSPEATAASGQETSPSLQSGQSQSQAEEAAVGDTASSEENVRLTVESRPFGQIEIDGRPTGRSTPSTFLLPPGRHEVRVFNDGLALDERREIQLTPGIPAILRASRQSPQEKSPESPANPQGGR